MGHHFLSWQKPEGHRKKMELKLYVGNLSFTTTEEQLNTLFAQAGTVKSVVLIKDRDTDRSKGFAFVEMSTQAEAEQAIKLFNGSLLDNRELRVNPARPKEESGRGGYGQNRGGFGRGTGGRDRRGGSGPKRY
jgi:cold-inducible RNA-binding protein